MPADRQKAALFAAHRIATLDVKESSHLMPTISMFCGIIIRMYFAPTAHPPPHSHVYYGEHKATMDIRTCEVIGGDLPRKQTKLVLAWAELHKVELMADWKLVMNGEEPFKIQPLQ
ncbi:MAG: DUF4160 domain-containing protein [Chromatiaceae bacterium]